MAVRDFVPYRAQSSSASRFTAAVEVAFASGIFRALNFGLAKLFFPASSCLLPKYAVLRTERLPLKRAAFFDLFLKERFFVERHCTPSIASRRSNP